MANGISDLFSNFATTTISGGASGAGTNLLTTDTTVYLSSVAKLPTPSAFSGVTLLITGGATSEIVRCTAVNTSTLACTITRGQDGTTAAQFAPGATVSVELMAGTLNTMQSAIKTINNQYCYLPTGWDAAWQAAKANSASAPATISAIGDSVTAGQGSSDALNKAWFPLLRQYLLNSGLTLGADYFDTKYASGLGGPTMSSYPFVQHGVSTTDYVTSYSMYNQFTRNTTTVLTPWLTFTSPYNVTGFDIIYLDYATGTPGWTYNVDGGANTNVNTTGPGTNAGSIVKKISITGLTSGIHTLNINTVGVSAACVIAGVVAYASTTAGLRFANHGWPGMGLVASNPTINSLADTTQLPPDRLALHQGYQGTSASPTALKGFGFPAQPDLAIVAFGINDAVNAGSATTFRDALRRLCQVLRYGKSDACSILICGMYWGDGSAVGASSVNSSDWTGTQYPALEDFYEVMRRVAREYNCGYVTVHTMLGRTPVANGWTTSATDGHPTDAGHSKIATLLEPLL